MDRDAATEGKSIFVQDPRIHYCLANSRKPDPIMDQLIVGGRGQSRGLGDKGRVLQETTRAKLGKAAIMLGAPEALHLCQVLLRQIQARRCLDIGFSTAWSGDAEMKMSFEGSSRARLPTPGLPCCRRADPSWGSTSAGSRLTMCASSYRTL